MFKTVVKRRALLRALDMLLRLPYKDGSQAGLEPTVCISAWNNNDVKLWRYTDLMSGVIHIPAYGKGIGGTCVDAFVLRDTLRSVDQPDVEIVATKKEVALRSVDGFSFEFLRPKRSGWGGGLPITTLQCLDEIGQYFNCAANRSFDDKYAISVDNGAFQRAIRRVFFAMSRNVRGLNYVRVMARDNLLSVIAANPYACAMQDIYVDGRRSQSANIPRAAARVFSMVPNDKVLLAVTGGRVSLCADGVLLTSENPVVEFPDTSFLVEGDPPTVMFTVSAEKMLGACSKVRDKCVKLSVHNNTLTCSSDVGKARCRCSYSDDKASFYVAGRPLVDCLKSLVRTSKKDCDVMVQYWNNNTWWKMETIDGFSYYAMPMWRVS